MKTFVYKLLILLNCFCSVIAQNNNELANPEKLYLHTDRNVYVAGDYLFYKLYLQGNKSHSSKYAYLDIRNNHNSLVSNIRLEINKQTAYGSIYLPDTLQSDIYQIVCYTNLMRNQGEDFYFTKEIVIANRFDKKLERFDGNLNTKPAVGFHNQIPTNLHGNENLIVHLDKQIFDPREKVTFSIETNITVDSITSVSVSVSEIVPGIAVEPNISDYFNSKTKSNGTGQNSFNFQPEMKESFIQGKILPVNQNTKLFKKSYTILVSTPDSIANMQLTKSDSVGSFGLFLNPYYEGKELIIKLKENIDAHIQVDNKFTLTKPFVPSELFHVNGIKSYLTRSLDIVEAQRYYIEKSEIDIYEIFEPAKTIPRIYYKPNFKIFPADFMKLNDFVEISRELLPTLKIRKNNDTYTLSCFDPKNLVLLSMNPAIFLDGVPIDDVNQMIKLGSDQIKSIEILPVTRFYGEMQLSGIVAVFTKNIEINHVQFKTPTIRYQELSSQNYSRPKLYAPVNIKKQIPDLRQLLLWEPEIKLHNKEKKKIEFNTSDLHGNYLINIQGITSSGLPVNGSAIIQVKSKPN